MGTKFNRFCLTVILSPLLFSSFRICAQTNSLDKYIHAGQENNLVLQRKNVDVKKAWYSLKNAESLFLPTVSFQGSYQTGAGGRSISLPVGELINPVYTTLKM